VVSPVGGEILISPVRGINTLARSLTFAGAAVPAPLPAEVRGKLAALIGL